MGGCIKSTFCCMPQSDQEMVHCCCTEWDKTTLQSDYFLLFIYLFFGQLMRHPLINLSNLPQMPNNYRMVKVEFFCNFSCSKDLVRGSCKRIRLPWSLSVGNCQLLMASHCTPLLQGSRLLCTLLEPSLHCNTAPNINNTLWKIKSNAVSRHTTLSECSL